MKESRDKKLVQVWTGSEVVDKLDEIVKLTGEKRSKVLSIALERFVDVWEDQHGEIVISTPVAKIPL